MNPDLQLSVHSVTPAVSAISSVEIAKMTGKNHGDVMRDIRRTFEDANIDQSKFASIFKDAYNRDQPCYHLPRFECDLVISGYSVPYRAAIIRRWHDLEAERAAILEAARAALPQPVTAALPSPEELDPRLKNLLWLTGELTRMGTKPEKAVIAAGKALLKLPPVPGAKWGAPAAPPADGMAESAAALMKAVAEKFPEGWTGNITELATFAPKSRHTLQRILPFAARQMPGRVRKSVNRINRRRVRQWSITNSQEVAA